MKNETLREKIVRKSDKLAQEVYPLTLKFPKSELYALGNQLRRAIVSVPANVIEGYARGGLGERRRFLDIAYASLAEAKYLLYFAYKQGYIRDEDYLRVREDAEELSKLLWSLIVKLKADKPTS